jgi:hypothetical protein
VVVKAREWPVVEVVDPSETRGLNCLYSICDPDDRWYVVRARVVPNGSFAEMAHNIRQERDSLPRLPSRAIMDVRGGSRKWNQETGESWMDKFRQNGLYYLPSVETEWQRLHDWLRPIYDPVLGKAVPKLRLTESVCRQEKGPLWALERFIYDPTKSKSWQYNQPSKDWMDCLRYLSGFPGLTWENLMGHVETPEGPRPEETIANSYAPIRQAQPYSLASLSEPFVSMYERRLRKAVA